MKVLYIGQHTEGTTSKMRADKIADIYGRDSIEIINTHIPFYNTNKIYRSIGVRLKLGKLITNVNKYIVDNINNDYDLIWVDKGIFITKKTLLIIKKRTKKIIHFTPDMAFHANKSSFFIKNMDLYDFVVTTKSPEIILYKKHIDENKIILVTQGYDTTIHKPHYKFEDKELCISFIGLYEKYRGEIIKTLINEKIHVRVAGRGWKNFRSIHEKNQYFSFDSNGLFSDEYSKFISKSMLSLGLLSKNFPELHTTRTFEIPACGTAIITERNKEIISYYKDGEALFFTDKEELVNRVEYYFTHLEELKVLTEKGHDSVKKNNFDYKSIIISILQKAEIL